MSLQTWIALDVEFSSFKITRSEPNKIQTKI